MTTSERQHPKSETTEDPRSHPAVRNYLLFSLAALFLLVVCLADRGLEWWCLLPALIGALTLLTNWVFGPPLVLLSLVVLLGMAGPHVSRSYGTWQSFQTPTFMDVVMCIAVLSYVAGHYRLLSLMRNIFPRDFRHPRNEPMPRRAADFVTRWEMPRLALACPLWLLLALQVWVAMRASRPPELHDVPGHGIPFWTLSLESWQLIWLLWLGFAALATVGIATSYLRKATATPEESLMYLQDQCWRHTRREQGILNRWLTWGRIHRKKENS